MDTFTIITAAFIVGIIAYSIIWTCVNNSKPKTSVSAQVVSIDKRDSGDITRRGGRVLINFSKVYYVNFLLLSEGKVKKFTVPIEGNQSISEGDTGILIRQGSRFISFKRNSRKK